MTNDRLFAGIARVLPVRPLAAALALLLTLPLIRVQAQSLRPSSGLRLPSPAARAGVAAGSASGQRQGGVILAGGEFGAITHNQERTNMGRAQTPPAPGQPVPGGGAGVAPVELFAAGCGPAWSAPRCW